MCVLDYWLGAVVAMTVQTRVTRCIERFSEILKLPLIYKAVLSTHGLALALLATTQ